MSDSTFELWENETGRLVGEYASEKDALRAVLGYGHDGGQMLRAEGFTLVKVTGSTAEELGSGTYLASLALHKAGPVGVDAKEELDDIVEQRAEHERALEPGEKPDPHQDSVFQHLGDARAEEAATRRETETKEVRSHEAQLGKPNKAKLKHAKSESHKKRDENDMKPSVVEQHVPEHIVQKNVHPIADRKPDGERDFPPLQPGEKPKLANYEASAEEDPRHEPAGASKVFVSRPTEQGDFEGKPPKATTNQTDPYRKLEDHEHKQSPQIHPHETRTEAPEPVNQFKQFHPKGEEGPTDQRENYAAGEKPQELPKEKELGTSDWKFPKHSDTKPPRAHLPFPTSSPSDDAKGPYDDEGPLDVDEDDYSKKNSRPGSDYGFKDPHGDPPEVDF